MTMHISLRKKTLPLLFAAAVFFSSELKAQIIHIDISGGMQYFPSMTKKIGWDYNLGGRLLFNDKWFLGAIIHGGFSRGRYDGIYANEPAKLKHNREAFLFGIGPGYMYKISDGLSATAQLLAGWGSIETTGNPDVKVVNDTESNTFKGFSAAAVIGVEKKFYWPTIGVNITTHYIDGKIMPSLNLKVGLDFVL
jgi:hypothetical protein